jgi:glutamine amidotransferase
MEHSVEGGGVDCIGLYEGTVQHFTDHVGATDNDGNRLKIPQMGWNQIKHVQSHPLWKGIQDNARFYFVHSYFVEPADKSLITGETDYGIHYPSALAKDNVFAIQSHPEKSADDGLQLLKNFTLWDGQS